jgi:hypothetical protein
MKYSDSETGQMIAETTHKLLQAHCASEQLRAAEGTFLAPLWRDLVEAGLTIALEPPGKSVLDIAIDDALSIPRIAGGFSAPVPLAENLLANWLLLAADMPQQDGPLTIAPVNAQDRFELERTDAGWHLRGTAARVPWARDAAAIIVIATYKDCDYIAIVPAAACTIEHGENLAREARDRITINTTLANDAVQPFEQGFEHAYAVGAAIRVVQMAGALDSVLRLSTNYVQERQQFGKPIGKFQAVQQNLAVMASHVAATRAAANSVGKALAGPNPAYGIAAAKIRAGEAATITSRLAHQVHGAMGFTQEYELHFLTKRLWSWRDEFGSEMIWGRYLGREVFKRGADSVWNFITSEMN